MIRTDEDRYWDHLCSRERQSLFALAYETASLEQLEIMLGAKNKQKHLVRPSEGEIVQALVRACSLGHLAVVERLLQEKADVNAGAANYEGMTALQAAAGGGHNRVEEYLLQAGAKR
jgi:ankyrin repeat protein